MSEAPPIEEEQFEGFLGDGHFVGMAGGMKIFASMWIVGDNYFAGGHGDIITSEEHAAQLCKKELER